MLRAIAVDDEPMALEVIKNFSEKVTFVQMEAYFTNPMEALLYLNSTKIDLVFLDIKMPDISGFDFLNALQKHPMVVFTTAYSEFAMDGFEYNALDYLLKPFSLIRFLKACNKAYKFQTINNADSELINFPQHLFIKSGYENVRIELNELMYLESLGNYVQFIVNNKKIISRLTMNEAEAMLPNNSFIRIHRSYMVAINLIKKFDKKTLYLDTEELPIGANYLKDLEDKLNV